MHLNQTEIRKLVKALDISNSKQAEGAWLQLKPLGEAVVPYLAEYYPLARKWQCRVALVFHSIRYARTSETAFQLGITALNDRATLVRYRACGLLAYSLRKEAIPYLKSLLKHKDSKTVEDAAAAINAIQKQNHHYFVDRNNTGKVFWEVNQGDKIG
jgi:hypothetical protein